jgi:hypothetical protein
MDRDELAEQFFGTGAMPAPWATDCPVRFDVWLEYAKPDPQGPFRRVDLILAINEEHGATRILTRLEPVKHYEYQTIVAGGFVVAKLSLDDLVRLILPVTNLYGVLKIAQQQPPGFVLRTLEPGTSTAPLLADEPGESHREQDRVRHLDWFLRLLAAVVASSWPPPPPRRRTRQATTTPPEQPAPHPPPAQSVADMLSQARLDPEATRLPSTTQDADRRRRYPVVSVTTNRSASVAVTRSRSTIKADAAEKLFSVDCSAVGWAVLDSGIDAYHPAFSDWDISQPNPIPLGTRVVRVLAFVNARQTLAGDLMPNATIDWISALPYLEMPVGNPLAPPPSPMNPPYVPPTDPHGTHVAGVLGGWWPTVTPAFRGICPSIRLYDLRVLGANGMGDEFAIVAALQAVRFINEQAGRLVIAGVNLSLSVPHDVATHSTGWTPVCIECDRLVRSGVVVVAAAGNSGYAGVRKTLGADYRAVSISDPGNTELVITVGSTHRSDPHRHGVSYFSSRGPTADGRRKPDLLAPGEDIDGPLPGGGIGAMHGTSQAAAHVSGAAAMLIARYRELLGRPERIKEILCNTATDLSRERDFQGYGLVDVLRAMQSL